jgi:hypothetical protein
LKKQAPISVILRAMNTIRRASLALAVAFTATASTHAFAESKAWTAAKKALPANLIGVGGVSFDQIRSSELFKTFWPIAMAQAGAQAKLDQFKSTCGFDPIQSVDSAAVGFSGPNEGAFIVALKGTTQKDIETCMTKVAKADGKSATISKDGAFTKYSGMGGKDVYLKWLSSDTFEVTTSPDDKALLTKLSAGGVDKDKTFKTALGSLKTDAAVWGVGNKSQPLPDIGATMSMIYGSADVKSGTISAELHAVVDSAKAATAAAKQANDQIAAAKKSGQIPPALSGLLNSVSVSAKGTEIVVTASVAEKDVLSMMQMFMGGMGGGGGGASKHP